MERFSVNILSGHIGSGKTTTGLRLRDAIGRDAVEFIDTDHLRRELGFTNYDPSQRDLIRQLSDERLKTALALDRQVVLCTPFLRRANREACFRSIESETVRLRKRVSSVLIWCECPEDEAKRRIAAREPSDGLYRPTNDPAVYDQYKPQEEPRDEFQDPDLWPNTSYVVLDTQRGFIRRALVRPGHGNAVDFLETALRAGGSNFFHAGPAM